MNKKFIKSFSISLFLTFGFLISFVYYFDPLQLIRKSSYKPIYMQQERYQIPALARTQNYDSVVVGTSYTQNFRPSIIKEALGFNVLKLSMAGSTIHEQILALNIGLNRGIVKNVIWGVDITHLSNYKARQVRDDLSPFPHYMYNDLLFALPKYLVNLEVIKMSIEVCFREFFGIKNKAYSIGAENLDLYNNWNHMYQDASNLKVLQDLYNALLSEKTVVFNPKEIKKHIKPLEFINLSENSKDMIEVIRSHPKVNFFIFCPPYSIVWLKQFHQYGELNNFLAQKFFLLKELLLYKNVQLYGFLDREDIIMNLNNYKDSTHFWQETNDKIIASFKNNENKISNEEELVRHIQEICKLVNKSNNLNSD